MIPDLSYPLAESLHLTLPQPHQDTVAHPVSTEEDLSPRHLRAALGASGSVLWMKSRPGWRAKWSTVLHRVRLHTCWRPEQNKKPGRGVLTVLFLELRHGLLLPSAFLQIWTLSLFVCAYSGWGSRSLGGVLAWHAKALDLISRLGLHKLGTGAHAQSQCLGVQGSKIRV